MSLIGITSVGAYIPYYYMNPSIIADAWGTKSKKGYKSVANVDEDSITMAVEAAMECFRYIKRHEIDTVYFASTTEPYAEKSHATLISTVLDLRDDVFVADFNSSMRSATSALRSGYSDVASNVARNILITAADMRNGYPKSVKEQSFGDAAAALTIGKENMIASIDDFVSVQNEIHDLWRKNGDLYVRTAEDRFAAEEGYNRSVSEVLNKILKKSGFSVSDFSKIILSSSGDKESFKLSKKLGIRREQLQENFASSVGIVGTPQPILMLIDALENSNPGDKLLMISYGNGADAFILTVTDNVLKIKNGKSVEKYLDERKELKEYGRFLSFRNLIEPVPGEDYKITASTAKTWREQESYLKLYGSKCRNCGYEIFPINRVCGNCNSLDNFHKINNTEKISKLYTYAVDYLAGRSDDPVIIQSVSEDEQGTRFYLNMTDFNEEEVRVGTDLEFTFRKIHELGNFMNYYWKVRPIRRKKVIK